MDVSTASAVRPRDDEEGDEQQRKAARLQRMENDTSGRVSLSNSDKAGRADVSEVYSPPRVTTMAKAMGMRAGWALDIRTVDEQGRRWDFS
eukprot:2468579-Heterocapsa_arctica.AAC.1